MSQIAERAGVGRAASITVSRTEIAPAAGLCGRVTRVHAGADGTSRKFTNPDPLNTSTSAHLQMVVLPSGQGRACVVECQAQGTSHLHDHAGIVRRAPSWDPRRGHGRRLIDEAEHAGRGAPDSCDAAGAASASRSGTVVSLHYCWLRPSSCRPGRFRDVRQVAAVSLWRSGHLSIRSYSSLQGLCPRPTDR